MQKSVGRLDRSEVGRGEEFLLKKILLCIKESHFVENHHKAFTTEIRESFSTSLFIYTLHWFAMLIMGAIIT